MILIIIYFSFAGNSNEDGLRCLLHDNKEDRRRIIILGDEDALDRLSSSPTLHIDGTFFVCPRMFYQQFVTIMGYVGGQAFPFLYAL